MLFKTDKLYIFSSDYERATFECWSISEIIVEIGTVQSQLVAAYTSEFTAFDFGISENIKLHSFGGKIVCYGARVMGYILTVIEKDCLGFNRFIIWGLYLKTYFCIFF